MQAKISKTLEAIIARTAFETSNLAFDAKAYLVNLPVLEAGGEYLMR